MNIYKDYLKEIEERKEQGLHPKPIDSAELLNAIIAQINDIDVTKVFSDCYGDVPPQELYEIYAKQRENVIADTVEA